MLSIKSLLYISENLYRYRFSFSMYESLNHEGYDNSYFFFSGTSVDTVFMAALIFFSVSAEISFKSWASAA